jgi:hypothetical protein
LNDGVTMKKTKLGWGEADALTDEEFIGPPRPTLITARIPG